MNFLAHIYLSGTNEEVLIGNFLGDFVKGSKIHHFSTKIQQGIHLHRSIDSYTDKHKVVHQSKVRLRDDFGHYAPVIVDVFYDHFLAKNWSEFSEIKLEEYADLFYKKAKNHEAVFPERAIRTLHYMSRDNWLCNYESIEGIDYTLKGMSKRTRYENKLSDASNALRDYYTEFEQEFKRFFPDVVQHAKAYLT